MSSRHTLITSRLSALAMACLFTLAMLIGIDRLALAEVESAQAELEAQAGTGHSLSV